MYIDVNVLEYLVSLTKVIFNKLFKISFVEVELFKEKIDVYKHSQFEQNRPMITELFPDFNHIISALEKKVIFDVKVLLLALNLINLFSIIMDML